MLGLVKLFRWLYFLDSKRLRGFTTICVCLFISQPVFEQLFYRKYCRGHQQQCGDLR